MNNFGGLFRFELKKIFSRKITVIVLIGVIVALMGANVMECIQANKSLYGDDSLLVGRALDDSLFEEMRSAVTPKILTDADGDEEIKSIKYNDNSYRNLFEYILNCAGNYTRAYNITESKLNKTFNDIIDESYKSQKLSEEEIAYWEQRRAETTIPPVYDKSAGWSNSIVSLYMVNFFILIAIAAALSGVFADEYSKRTDAIIFSSRIGKRKLAAVKILAGCCAGMMIAVAFIATLCIPQFILYGTSDSNASIQLTYGPTLLDCPAMKAAFVCFGIMLIISLFYSLFTMLISQLFQNSTLPMAMMAALLILSMFNPPESLRVISQIASYFPATFPGSWTFTDVKLLNLFGLKLNIMQALPLVYAVLIVITAAAIVSSYKKTQIKGR